MIRRAVLDTSILVAALRSSRGASFALLLFLQQHRFVAIATTPIFLEYEAVLKLEDQRIIHQLASAEIDSFLTELVRHLEQARIYYRWRPQLQDAGHEMILEAALNGRADAIVTHNVKDFFGIEQSFGVRVLTPSEFLKEVKA